MLIWIPECTFLWTGKHSPGFSLINRKLLLCSVTSPRIALAILAKQSAGFAFFELIDQNIVNKNEQILRDVYNFDVQKYEMCQ